MQSRRNAAKERSANAIVTQTCGVTQGLASNGVAAVITLCMVCSFQSYLLMNTREKDGPGPLGEY